MSHSVALVVIARDEAPRIGRLLASVAPWVDRLCVLDTGSLDATIDIARANGATVGQFTWCDDFSAARNAALAMADADWHLVLDADEWLVSGGESIRDLAGTAPEFVGAVRMEERFGERGEERADSWLSRVLPGSVRYAGRIHEQPSHSLAVRRLPIHIGHDGYSPAALAAKRGRNRRLLEADLAEHPDDAYLCYQIGKDAAVYDEHELAEHFFSRALTLAEPDAPWRFDLVARPARRGLEAGNPRADPLRRIARRLFCPRGCAARLGGQQPGAGRAIAGKGRDRLAQMPGNRRAA